MNFPDASRGETLAPTGSHCGGRGGRGGALQQRGRDKAEARAEPQVLRERRPPEHAAAGHVTGVSAAHAGSEDDDSPAAPKRRRQMDRRTVTPTPGSDEDDGDDDDNDDDDDDYDGDIVSEDEQPYFRGVSRLPNGKYIAAIYVTRDMKRNIGRFSSRAEAARAWDEAARQLGRKEMNFPGLGETRVTRWQKTVHPGGAAAAGRRRGRPPKQTVPASKKPALPRPVAMHPPPPPPPPPAPPAPPPPPPVAAPAVAAPLTTPQLVSAIRPPLVDAPGVAALLVAADYATAEQLAVLRGGSAAERHAELELLGLRSHYNRVQLLRAINALPPPPPPPGM